MPVVLKPELTVSLPFNPKESYDKESFHAVIESRNLPQKMILGYSILIDSEKREPLNRINHKSRIMNVEGLKNGTCIIGVKAKYYKTIRGKRSYFWTEPFYQEVMVDIHPGLSPVEYYAGVIMKKISEKPLSVVTLLAGLIMFISVIGFGGKIVFFSRLMRYRLRTLFRL